MPTYSYACTECDNKFDIVQSFSDDSLTECPQCAGRLRKLFNPRRVVAVADVSLHPVGGVFARRLGGVNRSLIAAGKDHVPALRQAGDQRPTDTAAAAGHQYPLLRHISYLTLC